MTFFGTLGGPLGNLSIQCLLFCVNRFTLVTLFNDNIKLNTFHKREFIHLSGTKCSLIIQCLIVVNHALGL